MRIHVFGAAALAITTSLVGCSEDDVLRVNQIQMKGTHNSYHIPSEGVKIPELTYLLPPLEAQLSEGGARQFELDIHYDGIENRFAVYHIPVIDAQTHCAWFTDCLTILKSWSDAHPQHHPIFVMIEPKDDVVLDDTDRIAGHYEEIDAEILSVWPRQRLIVPDDVRGKRADLRTAVTTDGWPALDESRGKAVFIMLDTGLHRDGYTSEYPSLKGAVLFVTSDPDRPDAAVFKMDDPISQGSQISEAVSMGFMIRTRADSTDEPLARDTTRLEAALASGAQMVSTDYPLPGYIEGYSVEIPGGTPSRCNPIIAPPGCTSLAIEDPLLLQVR